jgi:hypothetical protein
MCIVEWIVIFAARVVPVLMTNDCIDALTRISCMSGNKLLVPVTLCPLLALICGQHVCAHVSKHDDSDISCFVFKKVYRRFLVSFLVGKPFLVKTNCVESSKNARSSYLCIGF